MNGTKHNDVCAKLLLGYFQRSWVDTDVTCSFEFMLQ
jgi:hypothetical protein